MSNREKTFINQHVITGCMVLSIALIAFLSYRSILDYFFTGLDSLNLIEEGRFNSFRDFLGLFTRSMTQEFAWYRPLAEFSYGLDYAIWGLNPFGFQLTQLLLHISVSVSIFFFVRFLMNGEDIVAWVCALIFAVHPVHVEVVPVTARRNDMIITLFILPSLMLFMKYFSSGLQKKGLLIFSIFFYILALGTKELAVIVPVMIFAYAVIYSLPDEKSAINMIFKAVKICIPYAVVTIIYLLWRMYILGSMGGYTSSFSESLGILGSIRPLFNIPLFYSFDLIYPVDFLRLGRIFSPVQTSLSQITFLVALIGFVSVLVLFRQSILRMMTYNAEGAIKVLKFLLSAIIILSMICILIYPLLSTFINLVIQKAYNGESYMAIANVMANIGTYPVEVYFYKARDLIFSLLLVALLLSAICLTVIHHRDRLREYLAHSSKGKVMAFLIVWLLVPLGIYLATVTFDHHDMYISVIPFSLILSMMFVESFRLFNRKNDEKKSAASSRGSKFVSCNFVKFISISGLIVSFLVYSPLVSTYGEWEASGRISKTILDKLAKIIPELPNDAVIHINDFPSGIASYKSMIPHAREVAYYAEFSIKSWIDMTYPDNQMKVFIKNRIELKDYPNSLDLELKHEKDNYIIINIIYSDDKSI